MHPPTPAIGFRIANGRRIQCLLCPHACMLAPGQTGLCRVRHNQAGTMVASSYGRPVLVAVEPIEKKPLLHVWPGRSEDALAG
jgi:pyruvate formate lyase activating enzyme